MLVFIGLAAAGLGSGLLSRILPSSEKKELAEWLEVSGNEVRIYLNNEADFNSTALYENGKLYLPFDYIHEHVNSRFFWSSTDSMLSYTLSDKTVDIRENDDYGGAPAAVEHDGKVFIQADLVSEYSHVQIREYCGAGEPAGRVFISLSGSSELKAEVSGKTKLRTRGDYKAPVLAELEKGDAVTVTKQGETWSSIVTENGYSGFIRTKKLKSEEEKNVPDSFDEAEPVHTLLSEKPVMAWHGVYSKSGNASLDGYLETAKGYINVISPTWIQISGADGSYVNYSSREYISKAHNAGCSVWVSVDNFNQSAAVGDFNTGSYFESAENRRDFISRLMADAEVYGYDGFNLDFEGLRSDAGESYAQFIRELSVECRKAGLILSADNYVPFNFNDFYRMDEQGVFADYVVVMLYDEHTSEPGSNSSLPYVEYGMEKTLEDVSADRIIAALPFYSRLWSTTADGASKSSTLGIAAAQRYAQDTGMALSWDENLGQYYGEYTDESGLKQLWIEDDESLSAKLRLIREKNIGGIAAWRLGYDTPDIWKLLGTAD